ncbi:MAG: hypothetical protein U1E97_10935 [Alphaproteobacteria bacterium]
MRRVIAFACLCLTLALGGCVCNGGQFSILAIPFGSMARMARASSNRRPASWFGLSIGSEIRHGPPFGPPFGQAYGRHRRGCQPLYALDPFWSRYRQVGVVC